MLRRTHRTLRSSPHSMNQTLSHKMHRTLPHRKNRRWSHRMHRILSRGCTGQLCDITPQDALGLAPQDASDIVPQDASHIPPEDAPENYLTLPHRMRRILPHKMHRTLSHRMHRMHRTLPHSVLFVRGITVTAHSAEPPLIQWPFSQEKKQTQVRWVPDCAHVTKTPTP